jgi:hypothetical protein
MQRFGAAFGIALVSAVFAAHGHLGTAASFTAGYRPAMLWAAGLSLLGALAALAVGRRRAGAGVAPTKAPAEFPGRRAVSVVSEASEASEVGVVADADA